MSAHGFRSLFMAASVAGAALGCYLVSLKVASERAKLELVEERIVTTQRDIRLLQTEIGTRGRLAQLERWNANFIRLSAPNADQFLEGGFQLASMVRPAPKPVIDAPVVYASAPSDQGVTRKPFTSDGENSDPTAARRAGSAEDLMHVASYAVAATAVDKTDARHAKTIANKDKRGASVDPLAPLHGPSPKTSPSQAKDSGTPQ